MFRLVSGRHIHYSYSYHPLKLIAIAINNTIKRTRENQTDNPATININFDATKISISLYENRVLQNIENMFNQKAGCVSVILNGNLNQACKVRRQTCHDM